MPDPHGAPVDPRGILSREWARFARNVLDPIDAGNTQRVETQRAWYSGAAMMFDLMSNLAGPSDEPDEVGAARVEQVYQELQRYAKALFSGHA